MNGDSPNVWEGGQVMIIGSVGFNGGFIAEVSLECGRPTYLLIRSELASLCKASAIKFLEDRRASTMYVTNTSLVREHKIEMVISAVGGASIADQVKLVNAIEAAGTVKRIKDRHALSYNHFLPSEFGHDIDKADPVEPGLTMYEENRQVRRYIEEAGTFAATYFVAGSDIGKLAIKSIVDNRTLNKTVHFRPPSSLLSTNELASLWEEKLGYKPPRVTITEGDLLADAREMRIPQSIVAAITHDIFIKSCQINYSLEQPNDVEVCSLYPELPFRTLDE
ncbi:hypothetical protein DKX38_022497 [Salix brachista]|uniref:NmrA-like domain-containing protein n=1 Tax=Salix brachista TaxID=2182728 RepID=A0A5N5JZT9_9ROSI|nr:hypothetical protein DKX38_022497 [Salix brachista]